MFFIKFIPFLIPFILFACSDAPSPKLKGRDYSQIRVHEGKKLYQENCERCHGINAIGDRDFHQMASKGLFLSPPLNNDSMLWHRDFQVIQTQIKKGTLRFEGGKMPSFENQLSDREIHSIIYYLMSLWSDETYSRWKLEVNQTKLPLEND